MKSKEVNNSKIFNLKPLIISGPCSAETEVQVIETAKQLAATGMVNLFRAGLWKPRTRPDTFEGVGEIGLPWLKNVKEVTGLPVTIEVAKASHIEKALEFGIDVLWIGARTTVNPFSIQELADALRGVDIPILVKNPINVDIDLWAGAMERFLKAGLSSVGVIHRGFSSYGNIEYRNAPMWHIPIEMKRRYPEILMICDPSHICGNRTMLQKVAQRSIDLGFSGLMLESHIDPDNAWSDASQQITPSRLKEMLSDLIWRREEDTDDEFLFALTQLRNSIDHLDDELLALLSQRMQLADKIGLYKKENNMTILQTKRYNEILQRGLGRIQDLNLSKDFMLRYFNAIHLESIRHQNLMMNNDKPEIAQPSSSKEHAEN
jgi:chorismate mutase